MKIKGIRKLFLKQEEQKFLSGKFTLKIKE
jgi:hypothetical protein